MSSTSSNEPRSPGAMVCPSCGRLIAANAPECPYCGRRAPNLFGLAPRLERFFVRFSPTKLFFLANAVVFIALVLVAVLRQEFQTDGRSSVLALVMGFPFMEPSGQFGYLQYHQVVQQGEIWRLVTHQFLHANLLHIVFNMNALRYIGPAVERYFGRARFALIYLGGGVIAGLASLLGRLLSGHLYSPMVGASGALFALMGALVAFGYRLGNSQGRVFARAIAGNAVLMLLLGFVFPVFDNWAHGGGFLGGIGLGFLMRLRHRTLRGEGPGVRLAAVLALALATACLAYGSLQVALDTAPPLAEVETLDTIKRGHNKAVEVRQGLSQADRNEKAQWAKALDDVATALKKTRAGRDPESPEQSIAAALMELARRLRYNESDADILSQCDVVNRQTGEQVMLRDPDSFPRRRSGPGPDRPPPP